DRVPEKERSLSNKEIAISYAAYRTMAQFFYSDSMLFRNKRKEYGLNPDDFSLDPQSPVGIGNRAAEAVMNARRNDGSNQDGNHPGSKGPYSDYTGYKPANDPDVLNDIRRWQPKYFSDGKGGRFAPPCLTPHWGKVKPLLL